MWQRVKNYYHLVTALVANINYGFPAKHLTVIGVTGTDGKSTTTTMIYEVLKGCGKKVSMVSTVKAIIGGKELDTGFHVTTPNAMELQKFLKQVVEKGDKYIVLEISSHSLDQNRGAFIPFSIGVLTTLTHDHLDYHKTLENYAKAKFKLLKKAKDAIVIPQNGIPKQVLPLLGLDAMKKKIVTYGLSEGEQTQKNWHLKLKVQGDFNIKNALAAASVGALLGLPKDQIKKALEQFSGLPGRFEEVPTKKNFRAIIDFAATPDSLEKAITAAKVQVKGSGRIIALFGSASERDILKRAMMGAISGKLADVTVITDEDPRFEDPMKIVNEIAEGCEKSGAKELPLTDVKPRKEHVYYKEHDRQKAILFSITKLARKDDILLFCGKGHEASMSYEGIERPWSEHKAVQKALSLLK